MKLRVLMLVFALLAPAANVAAQTSRGTVSGIVTDPAGAVIRGAAVTLTNTQTNVSRSTTANDEGFYRFDAVELGNYTVVIEASGFGQLTKSNILVNANQNSQVDAQLAPGGQQVTIDVVAEAGAALQTDTAVRGGNISTTQVTELPIASRNPALLALTLPGVSSNRFGFGIGTFSVNGARGRSNNFLLDGIENNDTSVAGQGYQVTNPDAVAEVSVQTTNFDAEFGRAGGAVINTITKSGTNEFHGTLSAFLDSTRDDALTSSLARDPRLAARGRLDPGTQQVYSATVGGPVYLPRFGEGGPGYWSGRNRTFFFASYQEERQRSASNTTLTTPSAAGRALLRSVFAPGASSNLDTYLNVTQNSVATSGFQNIAIGARPGCPAPCNVEFGTFVGTYANVFNDRQIIGRIDHSIDENDQFTARYVYGNRLQPTGALVNFINGFEVANINATQNLLLQEIHTFSPSLTNDLRVGYGRITFDFPFSGSNPLQQTLGTITINQLTPNPGAIGVPSNFPQGRISNNYILQDTMTYVRGDHTLRFGLEVLNQRSRQQVPFRNRPDLTYQASTGFTGFANFIDDFGGSGGAAQRDFGVDVFYPRRVRQSYFFQDRWRASDSLTLTLGLRYEDFGRPVTSLATQAFTGLFNLDPVTRTGPYSQPNEAPKDLNNFAPTVGLAYSPDFKNGLLGTLFRERRTVFRAGYQVTYDSFFDNISSNAAASSPNIISTAVNSVVTGANPRGLPNLSASLPTTPRPLSPLDGQTLVDPNLINPYYQRWSVGVQRELPSNFIVDVSYVGSKGTGLYINEDLNPVLPENLRSAPPAGYPSACTPGTNLTAAQATASFPAGTLCPLSNRFDILQGSRLTRTNRGFSTYHAGQLDVRRRFANNLSLTASYTWSKLIDNGSEVFAVGAINQQQQATRPSVLGFDNRLERGVSLFDRTHRAVFTYVYRLPFYENQRGFLGRVLGGWEVSGVTTFETGVPVTVANGADADGIAGNFDRPDVNPDGVPGTRAIPSLTAASASNPAVAATNVCGITSVGTLYYTNAPSGAGDCIGLTPGDAFYIGLLANSGRTGNLGRNTLRTPGTNLFDMNFTKRTRIGENTRLEFRTEVFNIFNHPNYLQGSVSPFTPAGGNLPVTVLTSVAGRFLQPNTVGTDGGGRTIRYQLKFVF